MRTCTAKTSIFVSPSHYVTDAQVISAYLLSVCHVHSCVHPVEVTRPKRRRYCLFFKTRIREHWAHALVDTGASENFISEELSKFLGLKLPSASTS